MTQKTDIAKCSLDPVVLARGWLLPNQVGQHLSYSRFPVEGSFLFLRTLSGLGNLMA